VSQYKQHLLQAGSSINTINSSLASLSNYFLYKGWPPAKIKRLELPQLAPRALDLDEQQRLLHAVAGCKSLRNRTLVTLMLSTGLRISEASSLNVGDALLSARRKELIVRCGKGMKRRGIPINRELGDLLHTYLATISANPEAPLFMSQKGNRLSVQGIDYVIRGFAKTAGIEFSSHSLRHTCLTSLIRRGVDIVVAAEIGGHARLETTRRYCLPTQADKAEAMEKLSYPA
jgi:integrase/recombinase XerC